MREIKFRTWDKKTNKMHYNLIEEMSENDNWDEETSMWTVGRHMETGNTERFIFMQYTGLKDKNGQEIYEGDILNSKNDGKDGCYVWGYKDYSNLIVRWSEKFHCWHDLPDPNEENSVHSQKYIEVLGNIYENPELLKEN